MTFNVELSNSSYEKFDIDPGVLHDVNGLLYPYDPTWTNIGVNLSGGADSAVGTATLCKLILEHGNNTAITVLTNVRVWNNRPWAAPVSVEVYNKLCEMFPDVCMQRVQNFIPPELEDGAIGVIEQIGTSGDRMCTRSFNQFAVHTYNLDAVYNFITNNPSDSQMTHRGKPWDRSWDHKTLDQAPYCPQYQPQNGFAGCHPWKLVTKDFVVNEYMRNNWMDLFNTTRSCEGDCNLFDEFVNYTEYQHGVTPLSTCSELSDDKEQGCYWCAERAWALEAVDASK